MLGSLDHGSLDVTDAIIRAKCTEISILFQSKKFDVDLSQSKCHQEIQRLTSCLEVLEDPTILSMLEQYGLTESKIKLLVLIKNFHRLVNILHPSNCTIFSLNASDVSDIVSNLLAIRPQATPHMFRARAMVAERCEAVKRHLLQLFQCLVEDHIQNSFKEISVDESNENWTLFVSKASEALTGYLILDLLPVSLFECSASLIQCFQTSLDDAMVPMWSRLHFHLSVARSSGSLDQFLWTFRYGKSFVDLMRSLCSRVTSFSVLQQLLPFNSSEACTEMIYQKTIKFFRGHVAAAISSFESPTTNYFCAVTVESTLEFDKFLHSFHCVDASIHAISVDPSISNGSSTIFGVVLDGKGIHTQWVQLEVAYFTASLRRVLSVDERIYSCDFRDKDNNICFSSLFECLRLFIMAMRRYELLPTTSQDVLSEFVLERVLALAVGLCLLRIRSDPILYAVSCKASNITSVVGCCRKELNGKEVPNTLKEFLHSVSYFTRGLDAFVLNSSPHPVLTQSGRYQEKIWSIAHKWMPREPTADPIRRRPLSLLDVLWGEDQENITGGAIYDQRLSGLIVKDDRSDTMINVAQIVKYQLLAMRSVLEDNWCDITATMR